jgi:hypothetical protein
MAIANRISAGRWYGAAWLLLVAGLVFATQPARAQENEIKAADAALAEPSDEATEATDEAAASDTEGDAKQDEEDEPLMTSLLSMFRIYGYIRLQGSYNDSRMNDTQIAGFVLSEDDDAPGSIAAPSKNRSEFTMHTRLATIGLDLNYGPISELANAQLGGKVEVDFYAFPTSDSRNLVRMRKVFFTLAWDNVSVLAGQTSDIIAPHFPDVNWDLGMWGAGNLGDRRSQVRSEAWMNFGEAELRFQALIGLSGAVDGNDLDGNGILDGELSTLPCAQARAAFSMPIWDTGSQFQVGLGIHWGRQETDTDIGDHDRWDSFCFAADLVFPIYKDILTFTGEFFVGSALTDLRGGIFQFVNSEGGKIRSIGGWGQLTIKALEWLSFNVGYSTDDPYNDDLDPAGIASNRVVFLTTNFNFGPFAFGLEYMYWDTAYKDFGGGRANRVTIWGSYSF